MVILPNVYDSASGENVEPALFLSLSLSLSFTQKEIAARLIKCAFDRLRCTRLKEINAITCSGNICDVGEVTKQTLLPTSLRGVLFSAI